MVAGKLFGPVAVRGESGGRKAVGSDVLFGNGNSVAGGGGESAAIALDGCAGGGGVDVFGSEEFGSVSESE
jgi:hypothetical protein